MGWGVTDLKAANVEILRLRELINEQQQKLRQQADEIERLKAEAKANE